MKQLARQLQQHGYIFTFRTNGTLTCKYQGEGQPDPEAVRPLLQQAKQHTEELRAYLEEKSQDPRPDLTEDTELWQEALRVAAYTDHSVYGVLHGARCIGGKLEHTEGELRLLPRYGDPKITGIRGEEDWEEIRSRWLLPCKEQITSIFDTVKEALAEEKQITGTEVGTKGTKVS